MRLLIGTPAYGGMVHLGYLNSVLEYQRQGLQFSLAAFGNESLITRARNSIISYFYHQRDEFTHLLFLDADVHLPAEGLKSLLDFDKDVIGAAVPVKAYSKDGSVSANSYGKLTPVQPSLYSTKYIATAAMLLSKRAVIDVVEKAKKESRVYDNPAGFDQNRKLDTLEMFDVFQVGIHENEYLSEDYWLCKDLGELGYEIFLSDAPKTTHHGMHGFKMQR